MQPETSDLLIRGDMVGDKILIGQSHLDRAEAIWNHVGQILLESDKAVIAIGGPSGSGKSETAALIGSRVIREGSSAYVMSCDNYPWKPPRENDANRVALHEAKGEQGLKDYLGTPDEIDFERIESIVKAFRNGDPEINLRIMDTTNHVVHEDPRPLDVSGTRVLVLEGTWSNLIQAADIRVFLETDFEATLDHRRKRARDPITPFGETVLSIEQQKLDRIKEEQANLIVDITGNIRVNKPVDPIW